MTKDHAVQMQGVVKRFGDTLALDGVDLAVPAGAVYGLLGPNGAGKTTSVKVLTTLIRPDAGTATIDGIDVVKNPDDVRRVLDSPGSTPLSMSDSPPAKTLCTLVDFFTSVRQRRVCAPASYSIDSP